ncbi:MAG: B12-binding domain-containing radical SAM protein [Bacteriovoracaceae bacterium]|nr:B12-binding domain-containing radical SAM protein [Bacteriovoracaceae bacterium]
MYTTSQQGICLIRPQYVLPLEHLSGAYSSPPLGLAYLSGTLKSLGHSVKTIDSIGENLDQYNRFTTTTSILSVIGLTNIEIIEKIPPDSAYIGISLMFSNEWIHHKHLVNDIVKSFPHSKVILGGEHTTAEYERILMECPGIYACARGEGEQVIAEICAGHDRSLISGIAYIEDGKIVINDNKPRLKSIAKIPWPSWEGIPLESYLDKKLGYNSPQGKRSVPMLASRGCPYQCTFCSNKSMWTTRWVPRDIDDLMEEIKFNLLHYKMEHIEFHDLTAVINKQWTIDFCNRLIKEDLPLTWSMPAGTRSEALTEDVLSLIFRSGCKRMTYAPESGSEETLRKMKKKVDLTKMIISIRAALKLGFNVKVHMIMGAPKQKKREVLESFIFLFKLAIYGVHDASCFAYSPYPGTEDFEYLKAKGKIVIDSNFDEILANNVYNSYKNIKSWSDDIPKQLLIFLTLGGSGFFYFFQFLFRPHRLITVFYRISTKKSFTTFELAVSSFLYGFMRTRKKKLKG